MNLLAVFIGGGLGSVVRYGLSVWLKGSSNFPIATLLANVLASAALGAAAYYFASSSNNFLKLLIMVGFCGGFSTFSTFSFETIELIKSGHIVIAATNIVVSIAVCLLSIYLFTKNA